VLEGNLPQDQEHYKSQTGRDSRENEKFQEGVQHRRLSTLLFITGNFDNWQVSLDITLIQISIIADFCLFSTKLIAIINGKAEPAVGTAGMLRKPRNYAIFMKTVVALQHFYLFP
jgi:hypothetical protein